MLHIILILVGILTYAVQGVAFTDGAGGFPESFMELTSFILTFWGVFVNILSGLEIHKKYYIESFPMSLEVEKAFKEVLGVKSKNLKPKK